MIKDTVLKGQSLAEHDHRFLPLTLLHLRYRSGPRTRCDRAGDEGEGEYDKTARSRAFRHSDVHGQSGNPILSSEAASEVSKFDKEMYGSADSGTRRSHSDTCMSVAWLDDIKERVNDTEAEENVSMMRLMNVINDIKCISRKILFY